MAQHPYVKRARDEQPTDAVCETCGAQWKPPSSAHPWVDLGHFLTTHQAVLIYREGTKLRTIRRRKKGHSTMAGNSDFMLSLGEKIGRLEGRLDSLEKRLESLASQGASSDDQVARQFLSGLTGDGDKGNVVGAILGAMATSDGKDRE